MKRSFIITAGFTLAVLFSISVLAQEMNPEAGKLYNDGNRMLKAGNYSGAITNYENALKINKDYRIYYQKGVALKKSRNFSEAKSSFEMCKKLKPDFEAVYNALGGIEFALGNYDEAASNFEHVLEISKNNKVKMQVKRNLSLAYTKLGERLFSKGRVNDAISYLNKAVENKNYDAAYLILAKIHNELGNWDKSLDAAQMALKYRKSIGSGGPYFYMGVAYKNEGNVEKAKKMFQLASRDASYRKTANYELTLLN
ncbi:MAG: hypothetical protein COW08_07080 [Ignavibacteriales bacterium CG12_big_fil_rev_8_21_14_0_65_30_8]|nr:MAG: hypothetical protein COW08_07080 [Ignavibacteriales bacterium CG12_big_fil_rev_8_21_14_0_65_30_8]